MRIHAREPKLTWRTIAVTAKDPLEFARELETALQELTDGGFNIVSQMGRDGAVVITAQKIGQEPPVDVPPETQPAPVAYRRRIVDAPAARSQGNTTDEVLYHYFEHGVQQQQRFPGLVEALRVVKQHLQEDIIPASLSTVTITHFEQRAFPALLKAFEDDLTADPPLE